MRNFCKDWLAYQYFYAWRQYEWIIDWCIVKPSQVVMATIKSALSHEREQEIEPARLQYHSKLGGISFEMDYCL